MGGRHHHICHDARDSASLRQVNRNSARRRLLKGIERLARSKERHSSMFSNGKSACPDACFDSFGATLLFYHGWTSPSYNELPRSGITL